MSQGYFLKIWWLYFARYQAPALVSRASEPKKGNVTCIEALYLVCMPPNIKTTSHSWRPLLVLASAVSKYTQLKFFSIVENPKATLGNEHRACYMQINKDRFCMQVSASCLKCLTARPQVSISFWVRSIFFGSIQSFNSERCRLHVDQMGPVMH